MSTPLTADETRAQPLSLLDRLFGVEDRSADVLAMHLENLSYGNGSTRAMNDVVQFLNSNQNATHADIANFMEHSATLVRRERGFKKP